MTTYSVEVEGHTYTRRSASKAYPVAIVQRQAGQPPHVSFAGSQALAEREVRTRSNWQAKYPEGTYSLEILPTTAS